MKTAVLKRGDSIEVQGRITVVKCGLLSQGGQPPLPTVTIEIEEPHTNQPPLAATTMGDDAGNAAGDDQDPADQDPAEPLVTPDDETDETNETNETNDAGQPGDAAIDPDEPPAL